MKFIALPISHEVIRSPIKFRLLMNNLSFYEGLARKRAFVAEYSQVGSWPCCLISSSSFSSKKSEPFPSMGLPGSYSPPTPGLAIIISCSMGKNMFSALDLLYVFFSIASSLLDKHFPAIMYIYALLRIAHALPVQVIINVVGFHFLTRGDVFDVGGLVIVKAWFQLLGWCSPRR